MYTIDLRYSCRLFNASPGEGCFRNPFQPTADHRSNSNQSLPAALDSPAMSKAGIYVLQSLGQKLYTGGLAEVTTGRDWWMEVARIAFPTPRTEHEATSAYGAFKHRFRLVVQSWKVLGGKNVCRSKFLSMTMRPKTLLVVSLGAKA